MNKPEQWRRVRDAQAHVPMQVEVVVLKDDTGNMRHWRIWLGLGSGLPCTWCGDAALDFRKGSLRKATLIRIFAVGPTFPSLCQ